MNAFRAQSHVLIEDLTPTPGHERLVRCHDADVGLHALISLHSTARGPAAGGCRMWPYASQADAIRDVERLSKGMTYKNAAANLPLGGGKAVIIGDPLQVKSPQVMRAFGRFVSALEGAYYTAEDVGVSPRDMAYAAETSPYVAGLETGQYASGDPSPVTALGVFLCLERTLDYHESRKSLQGVTVAIQGLGHVGMHLAQMLHKAGAKLWISDINPKAVAKAQADFDATFAPGEAIYAQEVDVFAPCAMGGVLTPEVIAQLRARYVVGAANNQLAEENCGHLLHNKGIIYAPDYVVNGGGIINVAMEILGLTSAEYRDSRVSGLADTLADIYAKSAVSNRPPHEIADMLINHRLETANG